LIPGDDASEVRAFKAHELPENIAFELHRKLVQKWFESNGSFVDAVKHLS
jgi:hypothetical protein